MNLKVLSKLRNPSLVTALIKISASSILNAWYLFPFRVRSWSGLWIPSRRPGLRPTGVVAYNYLVKSGKPRPRIAKTAPLSADFLGVNFSAIILAKNGPMSV